MDLENGLVLYLPLNDGKNSTKVMDKSKYQNHGTITGPISYKPYNNITNSSLEEGELILVLYDDDETYWTASGSGCSVSEETTIVKRGTSSAKVIFSSSPQYAGIYHLYGSSQDWSKYDILSFWFYGANTGNTWRIALGGATSSDTIFGSSDQMYYTFIDNFTGWRRTILSLKSMTNAGGFTGWTAIRKIVFRCDDASPVNGSVYVDRLTLDIGNWRFGDTMLFDGTDDYIDCGKPVFGASDFSISFWVQSASTINSFGGVIGRWSGNNVVSIYSADTDNKVRVALGDGASTVGYTYGDLVVFNQVPHHVTFVVNRTTNIASLFVDGKKSSYSWDISAFGSFNSTVSNLSIGRQGVGYGNYYKGAVSNIRIYSRALSIEEIMVLSKEKETDLNKGLVLDLPLNDGSGTRAYDKSKLQNHGTITGATWGTTGLDFAAGTDRVTVTNTSSFNNPSFGTISVWINADSGYGDTYPRIIDHLNGVGSNGYYIYIDPATGILAIYMYTTSGTVGGSVAVISLSTDTHIAFTYETGGSLKCYINGKLVITYTFSGSFKTETNNFIIGNNTATNRGFNGRIKKVRVYNRALSSEEIMALYLKG